jgi:hypothetical protein
MARHHPTLLAAAVLLLSAAAGAAAPPPVRDARALSARIDELIAARLAKEGVPPAAPADDAEFFRRLSLDLNGRIPSVAQLTDFLDDDRPDRRRLWIDELITGRENAALYANHFANVWRRRLLAQTPPQPAGVVVPLEGWLRKQANTPYDRFVRGVLTDPEAAGFFQASDSKAEALAGRTTRLFLGVRLECAECHDDRSGAGWTRRQFWEFAAFFAGLRNPERPADAGLALRPAEQPAGPARIRLGETKTWVEARFLNGGRPDWKRAVAPRALLAEWITAADNPWFARAAVNRVWQYFFGVGLVEPVDGFGVDDNPPSHPELLDELAYQFAAHDFDVPYLVRAITGSRTYQRTSRLTHAGQKDPRLFARAAVRGLSAEQLLDSVLTATGCSPVAAPPAAPFGGDTPREEFLATFADPAGEPSEARASVRQALAMMNGKFIDEVTSPKKSATLAAVVGSRTRPAARQVEELYLALLSRRPRPDELARLVRYAEAGDRPRALRDILWALLNSTEFILNH